MAFLEKSIQFFLCMNSALRLRLTMVGGEMRQYLSSCPSDPLRSLDFRFAIDGEQALHDWVQQEFTTPFVLLEQPLYDFVLVRIDDETSGYFVKLHHIVADGWAIQLMTDQINAMYEQFITGNVFEAKPEYGYVECIRDEQSYLTSERYRKDQKFWLQTFERLPETFLWSSSDDLSASRKIFTIDAERATALRQLARQRKWSLNAIFVSAMLIYWHKLQQQDDLIIGLPVFNRRSAREKQIVGMFTSTMPLRMRIVPEETLAEFLKSVNEGVMKALFHQKYPYNLLVQDLGIDHERVDKLFQVCVNYYNTKPANTIAGYAIENNEWFNGQQIYALQVVIKDWTEQGTLQCMVDFKRKDYTEEQIDHVFAWLMSFIDMVVAKSEKKIVEIDLLLAEEKRDFLAQSRGITTDYPRDQPVQQLFEAQVMRTPSAIALICEEQSLTYDELNRRANQIARSLRDRGVAKDVIVGLMAGHSLELLIGIWGIMKAGGAYLPIEPEYPVERIGEMLSDSGAVLLVTDREVNPACHFAGEIVNLKDETLYQGDTSNLPLLNQASDLAYVIYTSGSTGWPKGIMIEHRALVNYLWWARKTYICHQDESFALYSSIAFDLTVTSIFTPLINGNRIVIYRDNEHEFVFQRIIRENVCSIVKATPSHLALLDHTPVEASCLRCLIVGGEDFRTKTAQALWRKFGGRLQIFNEYGPTEATVGCMVHEYVAGRDTAASVPIGHPIDNMQVYRLTAQLQPVPEESVAEMYVAGDGLARGYLNRGDLTAEKFLANPLCPQSTMYRTGDLARSHNGTVEYLGRVDEQVKIHGYRIELAEIESTLLKHEAVKQAVVIFKTGPQEQKYLVAFVQLRLRLLMIELKRFLAQSLPAFMIPTFIVEQQDFPLSSNGKIDRSVLAQCAMDDRLWEEVSADPEIERELIKTLKEVLQVEEITPESNMYFLGADSIKAIQIASRLQTLGYQVKAKDVLTYPIVQELALVLGTQTQQGVRPQEPCEGVIEATPMLEWFKSRMFQEPNFWHQSVLLELPMKVAAEELSRAMRMLIQHHDALRLNLHRESGAFFYNPEYLAEDLPVLELVDLPDRAGTVEFQRVCTELKSRLRLTDGLLFRGLLIRATGKHDRVLLVAHHTVIDGVSWRIILEDLQTLLRACSSGSSVRLPAKTDSLQRWAKALQQYADSIDPGELAFWQRVGRAQTVLPCDFDPGLDDCGSRESVTVELSSEESWRLLTEANRGYETQVNDLLVASLAFALASRLQTKEITLELESHGREELFEDLDVSRTVGWFTALYPVCLTVQGKDLSVDIPAIKQQLRQIPHKGIGFGILTYLSHQLPIPRKAGIRLNYLGEIDNGLQGEVLTVLMDQMGQTGPDSSEVNQWTCGIEIVAFVHNKKLRVVFAYSHNRYRAATIQNFAQDVLFQLKAVLAECCSRSQAKTFLDSELPITEEELNFLLED